MIDGKRRYEYIGVVAVLADIGRLYMCRSLAGSLGIVVATDAVACDAGVVEVSRQPGNG